MKISQIAHMQKSYIYNHIVTKPGIKIGMIELDTDRQTVVLKEEKVQFRSSKPTSLKGINHTLPGPKRLGTCSFSMVPNI